MADSVVRLTVNSQEYDNKLKRASEGLNRYIDGCRKAGGTLEHVDDGVKEFTQQLGKMETVATGAKGKLGEMTKAFTDLKMQFNQMSEAEKQSQFGKALSAGLDQLKTRIIDTKNQLADIQSTLNEGSGIGNAGGGLFGGDKLSGMLQVFGGNLMTKAAGMAAGFAAELGDAVKQGVELARQGEGIRMAFERLGRGDILQGLREATHGTVTDLELMKAAVMFNDFKLPVEELGTMLAFAQQKAKDTGQSVDYMVDSIVTGLGRKSLMILDNLGLSAAEIKEKMKETGDMTKAVGEIIREQMSKAGDYVETAADRATQANVNLQNKMEELGRKFAPVEEASSQLWTSMKISILDIIGGPLATLLNQLTEAGRLKNMLNNMNGEPGSGNTKVDQQLKKLNVIKKGGGSDYIFNSTLNGMMEDYNRQIMAIDAQIKNGGKPVGGGSGSSQDVRYLQQKMDALKIMRDQLAAGAKEINKPIKIESNIPDVTGGGSGKGGSGDVVGSAKANFWKNIAFNPKEFDDSLKFDPSQYAQASGLRPEDILGPSDEWENYKNVITDSIGGIADSMNNLSFDNFQESYEKVNKDVKKLTNTAKQNQMVMGLAGQAVNAFSAALAGMEDPGAKAAGMVMQSLAGIALGFAQAASAKDTTASGWAWLGWVAAGLAAMATSISMVHNLTGYAQGGIVEGNSYSGDNIYAGNGMINAGELVLTKAQQSTLASQLQDGEGRGGRLTAAVNGEQIYLVLNRYTKRSGKGELLTWK